MSWKQDGVLACASEIVVDRTPSEGCANFMASGVDFGDGGTDPRQVLFDVFNCTEPLTGIHECFPVEDGGANLVSFSGDGTTVQSCTITIINPGTVGGAHATGTFSAVLTGMYSAVVTDGIFDVAVEVMSPKP
jgi:hypothetical protein